jgi:hypothetical protein
LGRPNEVPYPTPASVLGLLDISHLIFDSPLQARGRLRTPTGMGDGERDNDVGLGVGKWLSIALALTRAARAMPQR